MVYQYYCRTERPIDGFIHHAVLSNYEEVISFERKYGSTSTEGGTDLFPTMPFGEWKTEHKPLTDEEFSKQCAESMERMEKWENYLD